MQHWAIFSVVFEDILPRLLQYFKSVADPLDVVAYLVGGNGGVDDLEGDSCGSNIDDREL
ncbi:MAG TPA: hypothetical protein VGP99_09640 [Tepidisphaeraceae bacterium]|nr:hypothetical protein [Tepidisphaeraceae bacterium]